MSQTLFSLALRHDYYHDGYWHHVRVLPDSATAGLMARMGLRGVADEGRFQLVYFGVQTRNDLLTYVRDCIADTLRFTLETPDDNFFAITDMALDARGCIGFSTSKVTGTADLQDGTSALQLALTVDGRAVRSGTRVGEVEIRLQDLLDTAAQAVDCRYLIALGARSTQWRYCIVNRSQRALDDPAVTGAGIAFDKPGTTTLAGEAALLFSSGAATFPLRQRQARTFSLVNGGGQTTSVRKNKPVIPCLPVPAPDATMFEQRQNGVAAYSQMNVYL